MELYDFTVFLVKAFVVVVVTLSILFGVLLPLIQNLSQRPVDREIKSPVGIPRPVSYFPFSEEEDTVEPVELEVQKQKQILKMALEDKNITTSLVRNWINEKKKTLDD